MTKTALEQEEEIAYRSASDGRRGPVDAVVLSGPFIAWLLRTGRSGWTSRLDDSQMRYVERVLHKRPDTINVHSVDELLVKLDMPQVLNQLYPD